MKSNFKSYSDGTKRWFNENDCLHREDGPACEYRDGSKAWYINNKRHRFDGPAIEYVNGDKYWYINGKQVDPFIYEGEQLEFKF